MLYLFIFWELSGPSGARMRTNSKVRLALPSTKAKAPSGATTGGTPERPKKKSPTFIRNFFVSKFLVYLES